MTLHSNETNGRSVHHSLSLGRTLDSARSQAREDDEPASYAAALIVAPLAERDIVDLMRRGFTVRPFLEVDAALAALVLGQTHHGPKPAHDIPPPSSPTDHRGDPHPPPEPPPLDRTYTGEFASQICLRLDPSLPNGPVRELVHLCARKTRKRLTVAQAAQAVGVERSTLGRLLHEGGYPGIDEVVRWMRLLHAAWLLNRTPRRSVDEVAKALDFASGPSMSNTMKNVLGMRPTEIVDRGGYELALATFRRSLGQAKGRERSAEPQSASPA